MSPKLYPLEIKNVGEDVYQLMSKGHHDFDLFMQAVKESYPTWPMGKPEHSYVVRAPKKGYACVYHPCDSIHQRAIPVTWTIEAYGDELYQHPVGESL